MQHRGHAVVESLEARALFSGGAAPTAAANTVYVKIASNWNNTSLTVDGSPVRRDIRGRVPLAANSTHEVMFQLDGHTRKLDYSFKSAKKTAGAGTFRQTGGTDAAPVYTLSTGTKGMAIATRYSTHRVPREGASGNSAGGSSDVLVKYTYYGDADLSGTTTLDDFTLFLAGYHQQGTSLSDLEALINSVPMSDAERSAMLAAIGSQGSSTTSSSPPASGW
jgi:hypothetical protein